METISKYHISELKSTRIRFKKGNKITYIDCFDNKPLKGIDYKVEWIVSIENLEYFGLIELMKSTNHFSILVKTEDIKKK